MSLSFDVEGEVAAAVGDRAGVWRFIGNFAARWQTPLTDGDGDQEADLLAVEKRLGVRVAPAIREAYGLFGRRRSLTSNQDHMLQPYELCLNDTGNVLIFRRENQGCARWGVRLDQPGHPDPPVVWQGMEAGQWTGWAPFLARFSLACLEIVLSESLFSGDGLDDSMQLDEPAPRDLERNFARLAIPEYSMWTRWPVGPPVRWFGAPDVILRNDADTWLWARARTGAALDQVRQVIPGDWQTRAEIADPRHYGDTSVRRGNDQK